MEQIGVCVCVCVYTGDNMEAFLQLGIKHIIIIIKKTETEQYQEQECFSDMFHYIMFLSSPELA